MDEVNVTESNLEARKACSKCKEIKLFCDFAIARKEKSGRKSACKACVAIYSAKKYQEFKKNPVYSIPKNDRRCSKCKIIKNINEFGVDKCAKSGRRYICKPCNNKETGEKVKEIRKNEGERYGKLRERERKSSIVNRNKNIDKYLLREKRWRDKNKERIKLTQERFYKNHPGRMLEKRREWKRNNPEKVRKSRQIYKKKIQVRISASLSVRMRLALKNIGMKKTETATKILGCSKEYFLKYLENQFTEGMNWDNYGNGNDRWNIEHADPCCSFDLTKIEEQRKCFHYSNLRPMWQVDNLAKIKEDLKRSIWKKISIVSDTDMPPNQNLQTPHILLPDSEQSKVQD